ncbi:MULTISPECIES: glycosyltransferase family 2 protein [Sphingobacterium]|uniref:glycosyltransferase family 2 protein n=1 Tax=Sphingobacterium TaxID=28453 RepID=UPI00257D615D|nr:MULTISPECIES: glycosyltransferase family 2 protein [Sphingobacterium]
MNYSNISAVILTYNEQLHLHRCLESLTKINARIFIVDSFSSDGTKEIAECFGANFYQNPWVNYATQFNWALENCPIDTEWVLRIDADEYLSDELIDSLNKELINIPKSINGIKIKRLMYFMNKPLYRAGMYPIWHLKIWRKDKAICEQRWMDERMVLIEGDTVTLDGDLIDNNLNNITWWTAKHNGYATREAIDVLDQIYGFTSNVSAKSNFFGSPDERRRWLKHRYLNLPLFVRPFLFFIIRYFFQLGFLEGKRGFIWNILQCLWYRFLVDAKIDEAFRKVGRNRDSLIKYFNDEYGYDVTKIN